MQMPFASLAGELRWVLSGTGGRGKLKVAGYGRQWRSAAAPLALSWSRSGTQMVRGRFLWRPAALLATESALEHKGQLLLFDGCIRWTLFRSFVGGGPAAYLPVKLGWGLGDMAVSVAADRRTEATALPSCFLRATCTLISILSDPCCTPSFR